MMSSNRGFVLEFDQDTHHRALFDVMAGAYAYHLDNKKLVAFLKEKAREAGVEHIDAVISDVALSRDHEQIECLIECLMTSDKRTLKFDLYVDCSGFRSLLLEKALGSKFVGLSGFPNPETLNMTRSCADEGLIGQPRLEEYGPCIARRRRGVVSDQARLRTGVDP